MYIYRIPLSLLASFLPPAAHPLALISTLPEREREPVGATRDRLHTWALLQQPRPFVGRSHIATVENNEGSCSSQSGKLTFSFFSLLFFHSPDPLSRLSFSAASIMMLFFLSLRSYNFIPAACFDLTDPKCIISARETMPTIPRDLITRLRCPRARQRYYSSHERLFIFLSLSLPPQEFISIMYLKTLVYA